MNQEMLDAVLKVLQENVHLSYYPEIVRIGGTFAAYDPCTIGSKYNAAKLIVAHGDTSWSYYPRWINEEIAKMVSLIVSEPLEKEENDVWNTGLCTVRIYGCNRTNK